MIVFRSRAGADVIMFDGVAQRMMALMGKDADPRGIVTLEQLPEAIARLKAAVTAEKARRRDEDAAEDRSAGGSGEPEIGLAQRAPPLIELLEIALAKGKPVTWGD